jgi:hypothetical protein
MPNIQFRYAVSLKIHDTLSKNPCFLQSHASFYKCFVSTCQQGSKSGRVFSTPVLRFANRTKIHYRIAFSAIGTMGTGASPVQLNYFLRNVNPKLSQQWSTKLIYDRTSSLSKRRIWAVTQLRRLVASFPSRRPEFEPRLAHVGFVVDKVVLG